MEPRSRSNDDQTQYQAQYRNGPEAGHWLVHEHRYERMLAPFTRLVLGAAAVARTDRVLDVGCGTGSTTCTAARDADDGEALGVDISRPLLLRAEQRARQDGLTNVGIGQTPAPRRGPRNEHPGHGGGAGCAGGPPDLRRCSTRILGVARHRPQPPVSERDPRGDQTAGDNSSGAPVRSPPRHRGTPGGMGCAVPRSPGSWRRTRRRSRSARSPTPRSERAARPYRPSAPTTRIPMPNRYSTWLRYLHIDGRVRSP
jgi:Methyltransferase domain